MSSWTAASSDCSRPVNNYVHVKTADLYRPNARLTPERQGYQVLTPFGKLGYSLIYRKTDGRILLKKQTVADLPRPGEAIKPSQQRLTFDDLIAPTKLLLKKTVEDLLDQVVANDPNVTRREEQLDQLCNILLLKLESDGSSAKSVDGFRLREVTERVVQGDF